MLDREEVLIQLSSKLGEPKEYLIAQEDHADGFPHIHCYFKAMRKYNFRDPACLDLFDSDGTRYHGNYQSVRSPAAVKKYVLSRVVTTNGFICKDLTIE